MPNKTSNYQLNQWEPEDDFLRTDFNEDNAKIEEALTELENDKISIVTGTYRGTGYSEGVSINVGFRPKAVILDNNKGYRITNDVYGGIALDGVPLDSTTLTITDTGFHAKNKCNDSKYTYYYIAIK